MTYEIDIYFTYVTVRLYESGVIVHNTKKKDFYPEDVPKRLFASGYQITRFGSHGAHGWRLQVDGDLLPEALKD